MNGFTKTLALESARKNITVNAVEPGFIDTDMLRTIPVEKLEARLIPSRPLWKNWRTQSSSSRAARPAG
ncbi:MAG: SDR family oxidoreductase [Lachnospiraceae bacterium]|nr:SDR family oxidoreductase [Lachnospiraceae bacterium]